MAEDNPESPFGFYGQWIEVKDFSKYNLDNDKLKYSSTLNNTINGAIESVTTKTKELISQNQNQQFVFLIGSDLSQYIQEIYLMKEEGVNISRINYAYGENDAYVRDGTSWVQCPVNVLKEDVKFLCGIVYQFEIWPGYNPKIPDWVYFDYCYEVSTGKYYEDNGNGEWVEVSNIPSNIKMWIEEALLKKPSIVDIVYPVGSIYMSINDVNPSELFGGSWEKIEGKFLLGTSSSYSLGGTGGSATVTLTTEQMPSHTHTQNSHTHGTGDTTQKYFLKASGNVAVNQTKRAFPSTGSSQYSVYAPDKINIEEITATGGTTATNKDTGGGQAHSNMPPYLVVNIWKRTG